MSRALTAKQLLAVMQHSTGYFWTVPEAPTQIVAIQTDRVGSGRWGVFLHGVDDRSVWNGTAWITFQQAIEEGHDPYGWDLSAAVRAAEPRVQELSEAHQAWRAQHDAAPVDALDDEFLAEFAKETAA